MTQNTQEAYEDFNHAIKLDPENGDIFHHRGQVCTNILFLSVASAIKPSEKGVVVLIYG